MKRGNIFRDKGRNFKGLSTERKNKYKTFESTINFGKTAHIQQIKQELKHTKTPV